MKFMTKKLSHFERIERIINGEVPDRPAVAFWRHFPVDDMDPSSLARSTIQFQELFDFDLVKVSPASVFCIKDWGVESEWRGNPEGSREYTRRVISAPEDWLALHILDPLKGSLGAQLECLKIIQKNISTSTPIIQTIFSPLSQAKNLAGPDMLQVYLRKYPDAVLAGLQVIKETTLNFISEVKDIGIAGIFYAVQQASYRLFSENEFERFGKSFDLQILNLCKVFKLNMVHIHGKDIMFNQLIDYPVNIFNWHDRETTPSLGEAKDITSATTCGGINQFQTLALGTPRKVEAEAIDALSATKGLRFILGTGCVTPIVTPMANLWAARKIVEKGHSWVH
jgi:uroporphyrinogen decarboxylase